MLKWDQRHKFSSRLFMQIQKETALLELEMVSLILKMNLRFFILLIILEIQAPVESSHAEGTPIMWRQKKSNYQKISLVIVALSKFCGKRQKVSCINALISKFLEEKLWTVLVNVWMVEFAWRLKEMLRVNAVKASKETSAKLSNTFQIRQTIRNIWNTSYSLS